MSRYHNAECQGGQYRLAVAGGSLRASLIQRRIQGQLVRSEIYRTREKPPERGYKPGFYVVVSRNFVLRTRIFCGYLCVGYSEILGLRSKVWTYRRG